MGTSSSRTSDAGPKSPAWQVARGSATSLAGGQGTAARALSAFGRALGHVDGQGGGRGGGGTGGGAASGGLAGAVRAGQGLGGFVSAVAAGGLDAALRSFGLEALVGESPGDVLAGIVDRLAGDGGLLDEALGRAALVEVLASVFDTSDEEYEDLRGTWERSMDPDAVVDLLGLFISQAIFQRFLADLGERIEAGTQSAAAAHRLETEILDLITGLVSFELGEIDPLTFDWGGQDAAELMQRNFEVARAQLEE